MDATDIGPARILVVEDDRKTADLVALYLRHAGHNVFVEHDGDVGCARAETESFDAFVLDVMLPGVDGLEICRRIRAGGHAPVLLLTARSLEDQRVEGLELGADDYVLKPFSPRELVARVAALLRRAPPAASPVLRAGDLELDLQAHRFRVGENEVVLTPSEFEIVRALLDRRGHALSRAHLLRRLASDGQEPLDRIVDVHVRNIRRKISAGGGDPATIETVRGVGYRCSP